MHCKKLPKYWCAQFIIQTWGSTWGWTTDTIDKIDEKDGSALIYMFDLMCGVAPMTHLLRPCINKGLCAEIFKARAALRCRVTAAWAKKAGKRDYSIDWVFAGVYSFGKDGTGKLILRRIDGATVPWEDGIQLSDKAKLE